MERHPAGQAPRRRLATAFRCHRLAIQPLHFRPHRPEPECLWGRLPNVHRHAPTMEQLRQGCTAFEALPPVHQLQLAGPESHR